MSKHRSKPEVGEFKFVNNKGYVFGPTNKWEQVSGPAPSMVTHETMMSQIEASLLAVRKEYAAELDRLKEIVRRYENGLCQECGGDDCTKSCKCSACLDVRQMAKVARRNRKNGWTLCPSGTYLRNTCDLCDETAVWQHSKGGFRCNYCQCPAKDRGL